jgi:hypothetical protein
MQSEQRKSAESSAESRGRQEESHEGSGLGTGTGETRQGVRHIIAARDEVRPLAADQQGRWSLPGANGIRGRLGVSGWRIDDAAPGTLDSALCTLNSVLYAESHSGRADRPRSAGGWEECHEVSGSGSGSGETMQSGQEKSTGSSAGSSTESSAGSRGDRKRRGPAGTLVPT